MVIQRIVTYLIGVLLGFLFGKFIYSKRVDVFLESDRELTHEEIVELANEMNKASGIEKENRDE